MDRRTFVSGCVGATVLSAGCLRAPADDPEDSLDPDTPDGSSTPTDAPSPTPTSGSSEGAVRPALRTVETATETVTLGDVVERSVDVENQGSKSGTVLVTLTAVAPDGSWYIDDDDGHETITVAPGESKEVALSWTPTRDVPEGEYDLSMEVWDEADLEDRILLLDEHTEPGAITVEKPDGTLSVSTVPANAMVALDGRLLDERTVERPVGTYELTVIHGDFGTETQFVTIEEGETTEVKIDLTEED